MHSLESVLVKHLHVNIDPDKEILRAYNSIICLHINLYLCFGGQKNHLNETSFEYPQHMFSMGRKDNSFPYALLSEGLVRFQYSG